VKGQSDGDGRSFHRFALQGDLTAMGDDGSQRHAHAQATPPFALRREEGLKDTALDFFGHPDAIVGDVHQHLIADALHPKGNGALAVTREFCPLHDGVGSVEEDVDEGLAQGGDIAPHLQPFYELGVKANLNAFG
jgi:hypothetical protein